MSAHAARLGVTNTTIERLISDDGNSGDCRIKLSDPVTNNNTPATTCSTDGWVSLDCKEVYGKGGERHYASALLAFSLGKTVNVTVEADQKNGAYCVVKWFEVF